MNLATFEPVGDNSCAVHSLNIAPNRFNNCNRASAGAPSLTKILVLIAVDRDDEIPSVEALCTIHQHIADFDLLPSSCKPS